MTSQHIKNLERIVLLFAVFVALNPCSIKESFFSSFDIAFERPLNKTKSAQNFNTFCGAEVFSHTFTESNTKVAVINIPDVTVAIPVILAGCKKVALKQYAKRTSGSSPPLYILYKRLKFDLA